jgi:16S rRNA (adenine1518-N6/adenine1519-N6)-dimethyltransferase
MIAKASAKDRLDLFFSSLPIEAKKSLGQNFLIADHVVEKIISEVDLKKPKKILEIGPGPGALTDYLRDRDPEIMLIELDHLFAQHWRHQGLKVFEIDALTWDWTLIEKPEEVLLVSNLPFQISSTLVIDRSLDMNPLQGMILMFQKEVAQRIKSKESSEHYGLLSVIAQVFWEISLVCEAGPRDFKPAPQVASRVLVFKPRQNVDPNLDRKEFLKFAKCCFAHRRKILRKNLESGWLPVELKPRWNQWISVNKLSESLRAEELRPEDFVELFNYLREPQGSV